MDYGARAKALFESGYNCCQAVFLACTEDLEFDTETKAKLASSFGGGIGGIRHCLFRRSSVRLQNVNLKVERRFQENRVSAAGTDVGQIHRPLFVAGFLGYSHHARLLSETAFDTSMPNALASARISGGIGFGSGI